MSGVLVNIQDNWRTTFDRELQTLWLMNSQNSLYICGKVLTNQQKKQWLYEDCMRNAEAFVN